MLQPFVLTNSGGDYTQQSIEGNVATALAPVLAIRFLDGRQLTGLALVAGVPLTVNHTLGRAPLGWWLTDNLANAVVWRTPNPTTATIQMVLNASANTTVALWVF